MTGRYAIGSHQAIVVVAIRTRSVRITNPVERTYPLTSLRFDAANTEGAD